MWKILLVCVILTLPHSVLAEDLSFNLLWNACTHEESHITWCKQIEDEKDRQLRLLELALGKHIKPWQRTTFSLIYYGVTQRISLDHTFHTRPIDTKLNVFLKIDEAKFNLSWEF